MKTLKGIVLVAALCASGCAKLAYTTSQKVTRDTIAISRFQAENRNNVSTTTLPLANGFAHNDYIHKRPLFDALENGFANIEADIFLLNGKLIVAHVCPFFKGKRTLENLYLRPLLERIVKNNGRVYPGYNAPVTLMIDIKTNADNTYNTLRPLLEKYRSILSSYENGMLVNRAVTIVLSGHKPVELVKKENSRLAFIDMDLPGTPAEAGNNHLYKLASCKYSAVLNWNGNTVMPVSEKKKLCDLVAKAHKMGARVRLWASPEKKEVWDELLRCGVDLINTDQLVMLKDYFTAKNSDKAIRKELFSTLDPAVIDNGEFEPLSGDEKL